MSKTNSILRAELDSSNLAKAAYDTAESILEIEFKKGTIYQFKDVPLKIYTELIEAESAGTYFNLNIKPYFQYRKL